MVDFHPFPPAPDEALPKGDRPRMVKALRQPLAMFYDGSVLVAMYELAHWADDASPEEEQAMLETARDSVSIWRDQCDADDALLMDVDVEINGEVARQRVLMLERYLAPLQEIRH